MNDSVEFMEKVPANKKVSTLKNLINLASRRHDFEFCVKLAKDLFNKHFDFIIRDITSACPQDHKDKLGAPFWSGTKRFPTVDSFNVENKRHLEFVVAASNLFAYCLGVPMNRDLEMIKKLAMSVNAEAYVKQEVEVKEEQDQEEDEPMLDAQNDDEMDRLTATMEAIKN